MKVIYFLVESIHNCSTYFQLKLIHYFRVNLILIKTKQMKSFILLLITLINTSLFTLFEHSRTSSHHKLTKSKHKSKNTHQAPKDKYENLLIWAKSNGAKLSNIEIKRINDNNHYLTTKKDIKVSL